MTDELWRLDATELAQLIRLGRVSSRDAVQSCLARLHTVNPKINAVVRILEEEALVAATAADAPAFSVENHSVPCKTNLLGVKGCGEAGCAGSLPSVMNAIVDALGGKHINMPATPERVWQALQS